MKGLTLSTLLILLFMTSTASALRISEVELNPAGTDAGNEWVELFSENPINLGNFSLKNSDDEEKKINGTCSSYCIINFAKQWLDNSNEIVYLYENSDLVDKTISLNDSFNNEKTWQLCNGNWEFKSQTYNLDNECESSSNSSGTENISENIPAEVIDTQNSTVLDDEIISSNDNSPSIQSPSQISTSQKKPATSEVIILNNSKDIKTGKDVWSSDKIAVYGFIAFSILIAILFIFRMKKSPKTEFKG